MTDDGIREYVTRSAAACDFAKTKHKALQKNHQMYPTCYNSRWLNHMSSLTKKQGMPSGCHLPYMVHNSYLVHLEFSVQGTTKIFSHIQPIKNICESDISECSSCKAHTRHLNSKE